MIEKTRPIHSRRIQFQEDEFGKKTYFFQTLFQRHTQKEARAQKS